MTRKGITPLRFWTVSFVIPDAEAGCTKSRHIANDYRGVLMRVADKYVFIVAIAFQGATLGRSGVLFKTLRDEIAMTLNR